MMNAINRSVTFRRSGVGGTKRGFTLMELLAVMGIMSILLTVASVGVSSIERGSAMTTALSVSEGIFNEARNLAISEGVTTRVVIHNDRNDGENPGRYLRYMAIAVEQKDNNGVPNGIFKIETRGSQFPAGVFFDKAASSKLSMTIASSNSDSFGTYATTQIDLPALPKSSQSCYSYEYNAEGICVMNTGSANPGAAFVLSGGVRSGDTEEPRLDSDNKSAFVIWRNGNTSLYKY